MIISIDRIQKKRSDFVHDQTYILYLEEQLTACKDVIRILEDHILELKNDD